MPDDFKNLADYASTRTSAYGVAFENVAAEFMTQRQKEKLRKMIGFKFKRHPNYNLPKERMQSIEKHLQTRVSELLEIQTKE